MRQRAEEPRGGRDRVPAIFVSHGSPAVALDDDDYTRALAGIGRLAPRPEAIVVVSAHFQAPRPVLVTGAARPSVIYDFSGFPAPLYALTYPCPGAPALAGEIAGLLSAAGVAAAIDARRGLDHGAWVPLRHAYPGAVVPVVEVSLPWPAAPEDLLAIGRAVAPLRRRGVLLFGSGGVVHNLARVAFEDKEAPVDGWAREFDDWFRARLEAREFDRVEHLYEGFQHANLSMRCFALR